MSVPPSPASPGEPTAPVPGSARGRLADDAAAVAAMLALPLDVPILQPLRAPVALALLAWIAWRAHAVWPLLRRNALAFALPALCLASAAWAEAAAPALRHGGLLALFMLVAAGLAARLDRDRAVIALMVSQGLLAVWSVADGALLAAQADAAAIGIFPQKNVLGQRMLLLALSSAAILASPRYAPALRGAAACLLPLSLLLLLRSESATAVLLVLGAGATFCWVRFAWQPAGHQARVLQLGLLAAALPLCLLALSLARVSPVGDALDLLGKDATLTGRTLLWDAAWRSVLQHPVLGVGAGNYWLADVWASARIAERFGVVQIGAFSFHNAYFEVAVHLGLVGLTLSVWLWARGFWSMARAQARGGLDPFWAALAVALLARSLVESELFRPTLPGGLLFWFGAFVSQAYRSRPERLRVLTPARS